jgi:hypothetical protein
LRSPPPLGGLIVRDSIRRKACRNTTRLSAARPTDRAIFSLGHVRLTTASRFAPDNRRSTRLLGRAACGRFGNPFMPAARFTPIDQIAAFKPCDGLDAHLKPWRTAYRGHPLGDAGVGRLGVPTPVPYGGLCFLLFASAPATIVTDRDFPQSRRSFASSSAVHLLKSGSLDIAAGNATRLF